MKKYSTEEFIKRAMEIHGSLYLYDQSIYTKSTDKITIICPIHGSFQQLAYEHLRGKGCKKCATLKTANEQRKTTDSFVNDAVKIHGNKYDYSLTEYINKRTNVKIICSNHGVFEQKPEQHLKGSNCPKCAQEARNLARSYDTEQFIQKSKEIHNDKYNYSLVKYISSRKKVKIICEKHGVFEQIAGHHLSGTGCPRCILVKTISNGEKEWLDSLNVNNLQRQYYLNIDGKKIFVDGYCSDTNTVYEYYGDYWHGNLNVFNKDDLNKSARKTFGELYTNTIVRENKIKKSGYNIVSIWENDFKRSE